MPDNTGETIRRTLLILRTISVFQGKWFKLTDLAAKTGLAPSTTHRYLTVLVEEGVLEQEEMFSRYRAKPRS